MSWVRIEPRPLACIGVLLKGKLNGKRRSEARMHEIGLMKNALDLAFRKMEDLKATRVVKLNIRIGPLSGVLDEALAFAFEALSPETPAEGGHLDIEKIPIVCYCSMCGKDFKMKELDYRCPECKGLNIEIKQGTEFELTSIEVD